jgi:hypothetical protein
MQNEIFLRELIAVGEASLQKAQKRLTGCTACCESASYPFAQVLSQVLRNDRAYFLCTPALCPKCASPIVETTLVRFETETEPYTGELDIVFIDEPTLSEAQGYIRGCERCTDCAEIRFNQLLDAVTGCNPVVTEYVICHSAQCPRCHGEINERTLVLPR